MTHFGAALAKNFWDAKLPSGTIKAVKKFSNSNAHTNTHTHLHTHSHTLTHAHMSTRKAPEAQRVAARE